MTRILTDIDGTHVFPREAFDAADPRVGAGTPHTAPDVLPPGALFGEPVALLATAVGAAEVLVALALPLPEWVKVVLAAIIAVGGVLGIRSKVTPT